jgi:adenylylsulfate kinase-like enzyme
MNVLLIGPPGSGKGTQGERLAKRLGLEHIAAGDLLRAEVSGQTAVGRRVADLIRRGELVPDDVILAMLMPRVLAPAEATGYVLDGFAIDRAGRRGPATRRADRREPGRRHLPGRAARGADAPDPGPGADRGTR